MQQIFMSKILSDGEVFMGHYKLLCVSKFSLCLAYNSSIDLEEKD